MIASDQPRVSVLGWYWNILRGEMKINGNGKAIRIFFNFYLFIFCSRKFTVCKVIIAIVFFFQPPYFVLKNIFWP